jgi:hypothetical protein
MVMLMLWKKIGIDTNSNGFFMYIQTIHCSIRINIKPTVYVNNTSTDINDLITCIAINTHLVTNSHLA